ncbi:MAG: glutaredoxin family protein [Candidatus Limnocylindrales bacterium]
MSQAPDPPELVLYSRATCEPCTEARLSLQWALEERAARGELVPIVREVDVDGDPDLRERYGALVPVVVIGASELALVSSGRQLRAFLAAALPRLA